MIESIVPSLFALLIGIFAGTITGLIPGIHINLIAAFLVTVTFSSISEIQLVVFIVALAVTHTFVDFIPSIFLGAASEDTAISILPGHKYLLAGEGYKGVHLTVIGSTIAIASLIVIIPAIYFVVQTSYHVIEQMLGYILALAIIFLLAGEKEKTMPIIIFFLAGVIGTITINANMSEPLLPLLTGLFGASTLIHSITAKTVIPKQSIKKPNIKRKDLVRPLLLTMVVSPLCSFLPGLGASQAATISSNISQEKNDKEYLILLGSINTLIITTSFVTLYLINKTRTGAANAIREITILDATTVGIIITVIIATAIIAYPLTTTIAKMYAKKIHKINYQIISIIILILLTILIIYLTGAQGLLVYIASTLLGIFTLKNEVTRSHLMGAILLPTTLYYLPFF